MSTELKASSLDFGAVVAFIAPGFIAMHAVAFHSPQAQSWLDLTAKSDQAVGVFLFVLLTSLALGLVVSGIRALLLDSILSCRLIRSLAVPPLNINWKAVDDKNLPVLLTIRDNFYRYYQFYANTLVALALWALSRAYSTATPLSRPVCIIGAACMIALLLSARLSLKRYVDSVTKLFS